MRWIYLAIIILFAAATIIFALQNFEIVTVSLFGFDARVPLAPCPQHTAAAKDRQRCGQVAPSDGLYLTGVDYPK